MFPILKLYILSNISDLTALTKHTNSMCVAVAQSVKLLALRITFCLSLADVFLDLCCSLVESSKARRARLEDSRNSFQFLQDYEEEDSWLVEKQRICKAGISAKDLRAVLSLQQKHKVSLCAVCCRVTQSMCWQCCWGHWDCNG